jgi:histidinol-phosphatase (PHP family)
MHDYHIHSHFCRHATGSLHEYAAAAVAAGLEEICFTPHIPLPGFKPGFYGDRIRMDLEDFPRYLEELAATRERFPLLDILSGLEADYVAGYEGFLADFIGRHGFDFVLMSVHFIADWTDDRYVFDYASDTRPLARIYDDYLAAVAAGIETGLYDCLAHFDLVKKPGSPLMATHRAEVEQIVDACMARGMSAEINASGTRRDINETYPSDDIVRLMIDRGIPMTLGSDAHAPAHVGQPLEALRARHPGLRLVRYRQRRIAEEPAIA